MKKILPIFLIIAGSTMAGEIPTQEKYVIDGLDLKHDKLMHFSVESRPDGKPLSRIGVDLFAVWKFFKPQEKFEDLSLEDQMVRIFGAKHGTYALDGKGVSDQNRRLRQAEKDIGEAAREVADQKDREDNSPAKRGKHVIGNNLPTWAGAAAVATGGILGYNAVTDSDGAGTRSSGGKTIALKGNSGPVIINEFGSGSGSTQNTGQSSFDPNTDTNTTTTNP